MTLAGAYSMRVFISWSGELSKQLAEAVREWLATTLSYVKPFFTPSDIEKGANWGQEISVQLKQSSFCVIALTRESLNSNWVMFEAGAISSSVNKPRICAILFDIEPTDLQGPLAAFHATRFSREDIYKLVKTINSNAGDAAIENERLDRIFDKWWPDLEESVSKITSKTASSAKPPVRSDRDLLQEVVGLCRVISEQQSQIREMLVGMTHDQVAFNPNQIAMVNALLKGSGAMAADATRSPASGALKLDPPLPLSSILTPKSE
jgi:TIR domain